MFSLITMPYSFSILIRIKPTETKFTQSNLLKLLLNLITFTKISAAVTLDQFSKLKEPTLSVSKLTQEMTSGKFVLFLKDNKI